MEGEDLAAERSVLSPLIQPCQRAGRLFTVCRLSCHQWGEGTADPEDSGANASVLCPAQRSGEEGLREGGPRGGEGGQEVKGAGLDFLGHALLFPFSAAVTYL